MVCCSWYWHLSREAGWQSDREKYFPFSASCAWSSLTVNPRETNSLCPGVFGYINTGESNTARAWSLLRGRLACLPCSMLWTSPHLQSCVALSIRLTLGMAPALCCLPSHRSNVWESSSTSRPKAWQQKIEFPCPVWCPGTFNLLECCTSYLQCSHWVYHILWKERGLFWMYIKLVLWVGLSTFPKHALGFRTEDACLALSTHFFKSSRECACQNIHAYYMQYICLHAWRAQAVSCMPTMRSKYFLLAWPLISSRWTPRVPSQLDWLVSAWTVKIYHCWGHLDNGTELSPESCNDPHGLLPLKLRHWEGAEKLRASRAVAAVAAATPWCDYQLSVQTAVIS